MFSSEMRCCAKVQLRLSDRTRRHRLNSLVSIQQHWFALFIMVVLVGSVLSSGTPTGTGEGTPVDLACSSVKYAYTAKGIFREEDVPQQAIDGDHLRICERGLTCCTQEMEHRLSTRSKAEFDKLLKNAVGDLKNVFAAKAQQFDDFFRNLMDRSKKDFHKMFLRTYGMLYETNSYLFEDMFKDLENYYEHGNIDLTDALDNFFDKLYKKMFKVLNNQYTFNDKYLDCVGEHMEALKPFGDIPKKLNMEVKRSFVATRTFVQALNVGRDVLKVLAEVGPSPLCSPSLMKMTYCPHCRGLPDLKPCSGYCLGVMKECLAHHAELDLEWRNYTGSLELLAGRLENSFNIESVVDPIDIKISEAIMNFQENGLPVSQKLFEACGRPRLGKRSALPGNVRSRSSSSSSSSELHFEKFRFSSSTGQHPSEMHTGGNGDEEGANQEMSMASLVQSIKKRIRRTAGFWGQLPTKMCRNPEVAGETSQDKNCDP